MTTTAPWLGINPAECLKDSDTRQSQPTGRTVLKISASLGDVTGAAAVVTAGYATAGDQSRTQAPDPGRCPAFADRDAGQHQLG